MSAFYFSHLGKTLIAKAVADAHGGTFLALSPSEVKSKWVGDSDKNVSKVFEQAKQKKTILFIDEIDTFMRKRSEEESDHERSLKNQFLISIDDFSKNMTHDSALICATNTKHQLDDALLRRIKCHVFCGLPDLNERAALIKYHIKRSKINCTLTDVDVITLAESTEFYSGSDLETVIELAAMGPIAELQNATHFLLIDGKYQPCQPNTLDARKIQLKDIEYDALAPARLLTLQDFLEILKRRKATTDKVKYEKYLTERAFNTETEATQQINTNARKSPFQQEIDTIFKPANEQEEQLSHSLRVFKQFERYVQSANNLGSEVAANIKLLSIMTIISVILAMLLFPTILWWFISAISLGFLLNTVFVPLAALLQQSLVNEDGINMREMLLHHSLEQFSGLVIFVFVTALAYTDKLPYFNYSRFRFINISILFFFTYSICLQISTIINFFILQSRYNQRSIKGLLHVTKLVFITVKNKFIKSKRRFDQGLLLEHQD
jgi:hypothetical protein